MKRKLLITTSNFPLSENDGQSQFMLDYANSLKEFFDVFVLVPKTRKGKNKEVWNGIKIFRHKQSPLFNFQLSYGSGIMANIKRNPLLLLVVPIFIVMQTLSIKRIARKENIDLINAHWILPQGLSMALLKLFGFKIPYILNVHSGTFWLFGKFPLNLFRNYSVRMANAVTCVSRALTTSVKTLRKENTYYLPLGIDLSLFKSQKKNESLIENFNLENKKVILFIGTMIQTKGVNQLLVAMKDIVSKVSGVILLMIGEGNLLHQLKHFVLSNNLESNVLFTGKIDHDKIPEYLSVSDVLCLPSFMEGFPMVVKEALASEVLVLTTALPVFQSEPELENIIFQVKDVDEIQIANSLIEILSDSNHFEKRKQQGRLYIEKNADWKYLAKDFNDISKNL